MNLYGLLPVCIYGVLQNFCIDPFTSLVGNEFPSSLFGYQNMTAEYVGSSFIIQLLSYLKNKKKYSHLQKNLFKILLIFLMIYLYFLFSRTAFLCIGMSCLSIFFLKWEKKEKLTILILTLFSFSMLKLVHYQPLTDLTGNYLSQKSCHSKSLSDPISTAKEKNKSTRLGRWKNTFEIFKSNWAFGIGPGNFEFGYLSFHHAKFNDPESNEDLIVRSPHNGYLEVLAENGIFLTILLLILISSLLFLLIKTQENEFITKEKKAFSISLLIFILTSALTAFPLENAYTNYLTSIALGLTLSLISKKTYSLNLGISKAITTSLFLIISTGMILFFLSKYYEANYPYDYEKSNLACTLFPSNWRACLNKVTLEIKSGQIEKGIESAEKILKKTPNNFVANRLLIIGLLKNQNIPYACKRIKIYDELFNDNSSLHGYLKSTCFNYK